LEFVRMPFGLKNAPITFQRLMDEFLVGMDEAVQTYMDDVIVFSKSEAEHWQHLKGLKRQLEKFGLKAHPV
ncbi:reverse transcriptase domain-containing protein, partial [Klebsiella pneumoniae]|uniref:reverse transcriptase domain-containing protein n=1 Tax=Klebsiella pneumoniae TaxID=573 RepID=UPI0040553B0B